MRANDGMSPIHAAAQMGHLDCLAWIVRNDQNIKGLIADHTTSITHVIV